jgi:hypothetical protein
MTDGLKGVWSTEVNGGPCAVRAINISEADGAIDSRTICTNL